ncbi:MAG: dienelactone hydrolase family protein [Anaerolineales bacterium]|nr:dienelactone hydrolase family protein [Anaerolineales bacterium]
MTITQSIDVPYRSIWSFCEIIDEYKPYSYSTQCEIPAVSNLDIQLSWVATESKFQSNWESISWKLLIDGEVIDLNSFDWVETTFPQHGEDNFERLCTLTILNLTPGRHTMVYSVTFDTAIDDGFNIYQAGTYEQIVNFTVQDRKDYPPLSTDEDHGQHAYSSGDSRLDYLLYLPSSYGEDLQQEWPLIVYLHGAIWRGGTPEMLLGESLPNMLDQEDDFPFIVLSPVGEGEYEFWTTKQMIEPLFALLDELQTKLNIDSSRIYLTGNDTGGNGVWAIALRYPEYFAALVPVTGYYGYPHKVPNNICDLKEVPVWAFHGQRDEVIPLEAGQQLVDALNACGGNAKLTVSNDMNIDVRFNVYQNEAIFDWLLDQSQD